MQVRFGSFRAELESIEDGNVDVDPRSPILVRREVGARSHRRYSGNTLGRDSREILLVLCSTESDVGLVAQLRRSQIRSLTKRQGDYFLNRGRNWRRGCGVIHQTIMKVLRGSKYVVQAC